MEKKLPHNVLIISNKPPYPVMDGGCFAMSKFEQLIRHESADLSYFAISTQKHPFNPNALPAYWQPNKNFFTGKINTSVRSKHIAQFVSGSSLRARRFYTAEVRDSILELIRNKHIDLVIFESIYAAVYLEDIIKLGNIKTILRSHNIEHLIWERYASGLHGLKKRVMQAETTRLKKFEEEIWNKVNGNVFISANDQEYYIQHKGKQPSVVISTQVDVQHHPHVMETSRLRLFHNGAMDWLPNLEGIEHFIRTIFPKILEHFPGVELHLAGKSMPDHFKQFAGTQIIIHGQIENADEFVKAHDILVVPILSGGGIRIKVLESMAIGRPVISTSVGIDGIDAVDRSEFVKADKAEEWISAIQYLQNISNYKRVVEHAQRFVEAHYSEKVWKEKLINFIKTQLS